MTGYSLHAILRVFRSILVLVIGAQFITHLWAARRYRNIRNLQAILRLSGLIGVKFIEPANRRDLRALDFIRAFCMLTLAARGNGQAGRILPKLGEA